MRNVKSLNEQVGSGGKASLACIREVTGWNLGRNSRLFQLRFSTIFSINECQQSN
jgi:hypothetical protein